MRILPDISLNRLDLSTKKLIFLFFLDYSMSYPQGPAILSGLIATAVFVVEFIVCIFLYANGTLHNIPILILAWMASFGSCILLFYGLLLYFAHRR